MRVADPRYLVGMECWFSDLIDSNSSMLLLDPIQAPSEPGALSHSFRLIQNLIQLRLSPAENQIKPLRQPFPRPG